MVRFYREYLCFVRLIPTPGAGFTFTPDHSRARTQCQTSPLRLPLYYSLSSRPMPANGDWDFAEQPPTYHIGVVSNQVRVDCGPWMAAVSGGPG